MLRWLGVQLQEGDIASTMNNIKKKKWKQLKKEVVAATMGVVFYHTWKARNRKIFKGVSVNSADAVEQIKKETLVRLSNIHKSKKANKYKEFLRNITDV